jgi:tetratricopeptide (TPR) repeat protein
MELPMTMFDPDELLALAQLDLNKERYDKALARLKVLMSAQEVPIAAYSMLGRVYAILGLHERAKEALETYLRLRPDVVPEHFHLGMLYRDSGEGEQAMEIWAAVLAKAPNFPPALYHQGLYLLEQGLRHEAIDKLNQILETADPADEHIGMANSLMAEISLQS